MTTFEVMCSLATRTRTIIATATTATTTFKGENIVNYFFYSILHV